MIRNLEVIAAGTRGELRGCVPDVPVEGVATDSRTVRPKEVFFALKGPNFDGADYALEAIRKGAAAAVVCREAATRLPEDAPLVIVEDTLRALGDLAARVRSRFRMPVVAVSGSAGKTTTKEMIASILSQSRRVHRTEGNRNNLIGLPLTLIGLDAEDEAAVVELGISEHDEMSRLVEITRPDVALITNIGRGHLETLKTLEGVAAAKGPLFAESGQRCIRVVNLDDPWALRLATARVPYPATIPSEGEAGTLHKEVTFSLEGDADVHVREYRVLDDLEGISVVYDVMGTEIQVRLSSPSVANIMNAAAAIAASLPLDVGEEEIKAGLEAVSAMEGRMSVVRTDKITVLNDTYNSNPDAVDAALKTLRTARGRKVAVLGEMLELGDDGPGEHSGAGALAAEYGVDVIVAVGEAAGATAEGALSAGMDSGSVHVCKDNASAVAVLKDLLRAGDTVLVKGSRGARLEEIIDGLLTREP